MKELRSFKDVIENTFNKEIEKAVADFVADNFSRLDLRLYRIKEPDEIEVVDWRIKFVNIADQPGDSIRFDIVVEAELYVSEVVRRDRETEDTSDWFCLSCRGNLNNGFHDFEILNIDTYNAMKKTGIIKLSDDLVPIIAKEQFDNIAEKFLRDCGFGDAITTPTRIPVREVANNMGLTIEEARLSRHFTIFGEIVFNDCEIEYYDVLERAYKPMAVDRGTILVDPNVYFMRCIGCWNNTVIHECIHWYKHKKYHELSAMYDSGSARISCQVREKDRVRKEWKPEDWMEWHANGIAPRVLMPKIATIQKTEDLIKKNEAVLGSGNRLQVMESVLYELADFFDVSRMAAKFRMLDLGYSEVEGIAVYMDDHYISSYAFAEDSKGRNQTFSISLSDSFFEYFANPTFRTLIDSGNFTYVDGHYVINDPKYVEHTIFGGLGLTDYAKNHVDECCIRFDLKYNPSAKTDIVIYLDSVEYRKATPEYNRVPGFNADDHNLELFARSEKLKKLHEEYAEEIAFLNKPALNFAKTAWAHIERLNCSRKDFCEKTLLSDKTYDRLRDNRVPNPSLQTVMQICVGLELGGALGEQLLELAGYKLNNQQLAYKKILHSYRGHSIYECDEVLTALGMPSILPKQYRGTE